MYYIHPTECIECGMCESICPVDAIRYADEVEEAEQPFIELNVAAFCDDNGTLQEPGGWTKKQPAIKDPAHLPEVTAQVRKVLELAKTSLPED